MIEKRTRPLWAALYRSKTKAEQERCHILNENCVPKLFTTKKAAKVWIDEVYGYIRNRPDLRAEPHGLRMPVPVRVFVGLDPAEAPK